jgi:methyl-accepting chemotaxis protein
MTISHKKIGMAIVLAVIVGTSTYMADAMVRDKAVERFSQKFALLGTLRKSALEAYLATIRAEVTFWSVSESLRNIGLELQTSWDALPPEQVGALQDFYGGEDPGNDNVTLTKALQESGYGGAHASLHDLVAEFVPARGYYDFFLIDQAGNIVYTVEKESDFATNLLEGPYRETGIADVFLRALQDETNAVHFSDFERYAPSDGEPAIFAAHRMTDADGHSMGVMAVQLPTAKIIEIMQFDTGMGESGETYLVGQDLLMRSDSRFSEATTILSTTVDTETVALALAGERGIAFTADYRGVEVLSAYDSLQTAGFRWAVMAEIDEAEVRDETAGLGGILAAIAAALFALALWTVGVIGRLVWPSDSVDGPLDELVDIDIG